MDAVESELHEAALDLLGRLRLGHGLNDDATERLKKALRAATVAWSDSDVITKSAASLFAELASCIEADSHAYKGAEAKQIFDLSIEIAELVQDCVSIKREITPR